MIILIRIMLVITLMVIIIIMMTTSLMITMLIVIIVSFFMGEVTCKYCSTMSFTNKSRFKKINELRN